MSEFTSFIINFFLFIIYHLNCFYADDLHYELLIISRNNYIHLIAVY